jgi:cyclophilin family peptidyl-prolyl cis-trans isomerase
MEIFMLERSRWGQSRFAAALLIGGSLLACTAGTRAQTAVPPADARAALLDPAHPFWNTRAPDTFRARFETTKGPFVLEVFRAWAPVGADRFYNLIRSGFYDDSRLSRVVDGWIVQWGIPGDPQVGAVWRTRGMPDDSVRQSNVRGTFAYAMTGPGERTTQVYISLRDNSRQDAQGFAPLGRVAAGMDVVDRLHSGYGEGSGGGMRAGKQGPLFEGGNAYIDQNYPLLDKIIRARIE